MSARAALLCVMLAGCPGEDVVRDATTVDETTTDGVSETVSDIEVTVEVPRRVLFIGNSYTYFNDLPAVVRALGEATPGGRVEVEMIAEGGAALSTHLANGDTTARVADGDFDVVVLQGQSLEPIIFSESFDASAYQWATAVDLAGAQAVWFATWARREGNAAYADFGIPNPTWMAHGIEQRYRMAAAHFDDVVARVGAAWLAPYVGPEVDLFDPDGSHPSKAGTLLSACVLLQGITGETPRVPTPAPLGLADDVAQALCALAPLVRCGADESFCDGACVDVRSNPDRCGDCVTACRPDDPCMNGRCGCEDALTGCDRTCVYLGNDASHCGDCDVACAPGQYCEDEECHCPEAAVMPVELASLHADCASQDTSGGDACRTSAHAHCAELACFDSGFGPPSGHAPVVSELLCLVGEPLNTTFTALAEIDPVCQPGDPPSAACAGAIHRLCAQFNWTSGFGPYAQDGAAIGITCIDHGARVETDAAVLASFASRCSPDPYSCSVAAWSFCVAQGFGGGFGPVEADGDARTVICLDP